MSKNSDELKQAYLDYIGKRPDTREALYAEAARSGFLKGYKG